MRYYEPLQIYRLWHFNDEDNYEFSEFDPVQDHIKNLWIKGKNLKIQLDINKNIFKIGDYDVTLKDIKKETFLYEVFENYTEAELYILPVMLSGKKRNEQTDGWIKLDYGGNPKDFMQCNKCSTHRMEPIDNGYDNIESGAIYVCSNHKCDNEDASSIVYKKPDIKKWIEEVKRVEKDSKCLEINEFSLKWLEKDSPGILDRDDKCECGASSLFEEPYLIIIPKEKGSTAFGTTCWLKLYCRVCAKHNMSRSVIKDEEFLNALFGDDR